MTQFYCTIEVIYRIHVVEPVEPTTFSSFLAQDVRQRVRVHWRSADARCPNDCWNRVTFAAFSSWWNHVVFASTCWLQLLHRSSRSLAWISMIFPSQPMRHGVITSREELRFLWDKFRHLMLLPFQKVTVIPCNASIKKDRHTSCVHLLPVKDIAHGKYPANQS